MGLKSIKISVIIILGFFLIYPNHSQAGWITEEISKGGYQSSIALNPFGYPHISHVDYSDGGSQVLKHAFFDGNRWNTEVVDEEEFEGENAIAVDSLGHIHISYCIYEYPGFSLKYAYFDGIKWTITWLEKGGDSISITVDSNNYPHISHINMVNELRYMRYNGSEWIGETIASNTLQWGGTALALTSSGKAHISFSDPSIPRRLFWANNLSGTWEIEYLGEGRQSSLALDSLGNPHIVYYSDAAREIRYARQVGSVWETQAIADDPDGVDDPDIALDSQDHPHICFEFDSTYPNGGGIKYAYFDGVEWLYSLIESKDTGGPSIALDKAGFPHVSYGSFRNNSIYLKYAHMEGVAPSPPTNVQASDGAYLDKVQVTWGASATATYYTVYRATSSSTWASKTNLGSTSDTFFNDTTAVPMTTYYYYVKASNASGASGFSSYDTGYRSDRSPAAPTNISASDGTYMDKVEVTWTASPGATSYTVYRATSTSRRATKVAVGTTTDTTYDDTTATVGKTYYYYVTASNSYGTSNYSAYDIGYRSDGRPSVPTNVQASDGTYMEKVEVTWTASPGATLYTVYRATSTSRRATKVVMGTTTDPTYDDTTASAGVTYYYYVKASNSYGESGFSAYDTGYR